MIIGGLDDARGGVGAVADVGEIDHTDVRWKVIDGPGGHDEGQLRVVDDEIDSLGGVGGIDRDVGRAGTEHAEDRHDQLDAAPDAALSLRERGPIAGYWGVTPT